MPPPNGRADKKYSAYIKAQLLHEKGDQEWRSKTVATKDVPEAGGDIMWNGRFEWEYEEDDLAFLRCVGRLTHPPMLMQQHSFVFCHSSGSSYKRTSLGKMMKW